MHVKQLLVPLLLSGLFLSYAAMAETAQPAADAAGASPGQVPAASSDSKPAEKPAHWSYGGSEGPAYWGELSADYSQCSIGRNQSPVDLNQDDAIRSSKDAVQVDYQPMGYELVNNGHTLQATPQGSQPPLQIGSRTFTLKQFHFHDPSEHTFKGRHFPLDLHLVHGAEDGALAVLAVVFQEGDENPALAPLVAESLSRGQTRKLAEPVKASKAQIEALGQIMGGPNNRPVQPLNARILVDDDR